MSSQGLILHDEGVEGFFLLLSLPFFHIFSSQRDNFFNFSPFIFIQVLCMKTSSITTDPEVLLFLSLWLSFLGQSALQMALQWYQAFRYQTFRVLQWNEIESSVSHSLSPALSHSLSQQFIIQDQVSIEAARVSCFSLGFVLSSISGMKKRTQLQTWGSETPWRSPQSNLMR